MDGRGTLLEKFVHQENVLVLAIYKKGPAADTFPLEAKTLIQLNCPLVSGKDFQLHLLKPALSLVEGGF